jgi:hypothetical protein
MTIQVAQQMLPPPDGSRNSILNYSTTVGVPIAVQPWDITLLQANGWTFYVGGQSAAIPQAPSIAIPGGCLAAFSVVPVNGYSGMCLRVQRASDNAQFDVGFINGGVNWAAADAFAAGSILTVVKWYDQSGNGNHLISNSASPPTFMGYSNFSGIRPVNFNALGSDFLAHSSMTTPLIFNANAFTTYQVVAPRVNNQPGCFFSMHQAGTPIVALTCSRDLSPLTSQIYVNGAFSSLGFPPPCAVQCWSMSGAGTANVAGVASTYPAQSATAIDSFILGDDSTLYSFSGDMFFVAIYPSNHSTASQVTTSAEVTSVFNDNILQNKRILFDGNSLATSIHQSYGRTIEIQAGFGRTRTEDGNGLFALASLPDWQLYNCSAGGRTLATEASAGPAAYMTALGAMPAGFTKNIILISDPTNDIGTDAFASTAAAQAAMSTLWTGTVLPLITNLLSYGFTGVVVPTVIPRNGFQAGSGNYYEDARIAYNNLVRTSVVGNGYAVSDRAALGPFSKINSWQNNTYYFVDGVHLVDLGQSVLAACDRAAILSL